MNTGVALRTANRLRRDNAFCVRRELGRRSANHRGFPNPFPKLLNPSESVPLKPTMEISPPTLLASAVAVTEAWRSSPAITPVVSESDSAHDYAASICSKTTKSGFRAPSRWGKGSLGACVKSSESLARLTNSSTRISPIYNRRFAISPREGSDFHVKLEENSIDLSAVFSVVTSRKVSEDAVIRLMRAMI